MSDLRLVAASQDSAAAEDQPGTASESHLLLLKQRKYCDVTFTFPNLPTRIEAHEFCLKARSPVFEEIFRKRKPGSVRSMEIEISESTPEQFQKFLEFIYSDKFEEDMCVALELLPLANKYKVHSLVKKCEQLLKTEIQVQHSVKVFQAASRYGRQHMMDRAGQLMVKSFLDLLKSGALYNADERTVLFLLEQDDLKMKEVQLFQFIIEWARHQSGGCNDEQLLKDKLKNVISKIRYPSMTAYEFSKVVAPTGLLSAEEKLSVYSYLLEDEKMREDVNMKFNIKRRKMEKVEKTIQFREGPTLQFVKGAAFPKQGMSFQAERMQHVTKVWSDVLVKKAMITGIRVWWPVLSRKCHERGFSLNVNISIGEYSGLVNEENFVTSFQKTLLECKENQEEEVSVEPPIEFVTGRTYCIFAEDQSTSDLNDSYRDGLFVYDGLAHSSEPTAEARVDMDGTRLTMKDIRCSTENDGLERPKIAVVTGITVNLV